MTDHDTNPTETERDAARALDTDPMGLEPPPSFVGQPPEDIPGAPPWANLLFREMREEKALLRQILANQDMQRKQHDTFKAEARGHLHNHDTDIQWLKEGQATSDEQHLSTDGRLTTVEGKVKHLEDLVIGDEGL